MSLPGKHAMLVGGSVESLRDIQEWIATIQDPSHLLCARPKLVIHQLRQGFPQLILITRKGPSLSHLQRGPAHHHPTLATAFPTPPSLSRLETKDYKIQFQGFDPFPSSSVLNFDI